MILTREQIEKLLEGGMKAPDVAFTALALYAERDALKEALDILNKAIDKSVLHYNDEEVDGRFIDPEILAEELGLLTWKGRDKRSVPVKE